MDEYISRKAAIDATYTLHFKDSIQEALRNLPAADVVARDCFDRILAQNDTMREMLAQIGKKPGDSMDDVRPVRYGKWEKYGWSIRCSECGYDMPFATRNFCPQLRGYDGGKLMYDELIKALHDGAEFLECSTPGIKNSFAKMCHNAADAIEELQKRVPKRPHGRLGDLDELEKIFREDADAEWNRFASPVNWADAFDDVANIVADAPTIIPANEGK